MRKIFVCAALMLPSLFYGQDCEICKLTSKKIDTIALKEFDVEAGSQHKLTLLDDRADTTKIGYYERHGLKKAGKESATIFYPFQLEYGTATGLSQLLLAGLSNEFKQKKLSVTGFIKIFWIYEYNNLEEEREFSKPDKKRQRLVFKADYFLEKDNKFYPFARIDTSFTGRVADFSDDEHLIWQLATIHSKKFSEVTIERVYNRNSYTMDFIRSKNAVANHAILEAKTTYKKGIYRSFDEFLSNSPGLVLKDVKRSKYTDEIYTDSAAGGTQRVTDAWGYSDGAGVFYKLGADFFQLARTGQTFELLGYNRLQNYTSNYSWMSPGNNLLTTPVILLPLTVFDMSRSRHSPFYFPMQIDIQKGTVY
jgi:hypothetical protein